MAVPTRTSRQASAGQRRFARAGRQAAASQGRFARTGRYARTTATPRRMTPTQGLRRRRQPPPSGMKKAVTALLPTAAAKKATPGSKKGKAGGLALIAAAAGMAFKNRGKLGELRRKQSGDTSPTTPAAADNASAPPATPPI
jgi:hypothetical protein